MEERPPGRSDPETTDNNRELPPGRPTSRGSGADDGGASPRPLRFPRNAADVTSDPTSAAFARDPAAEGIRRRSTMATRRTGIPSLAPRTSLAQRTQGQFTLAGPDDTQQLQTAHAPFVHPGYVDLNPAYEQPHNAKPVWSLAKPLPRVVRPGMVPTKNELLENRMAAELPAENSQKAGVDADPNELEKGRIEKSANLKKVAAQVEDARLQRENNFIKTVIQGGQAGAGSSRLSRISSGQVCSPSRPGPGAGQASSQLSTVPEGGSKTGGSVGDTQHSEDEGGSAQSVDLDMAHDEPIEGDASLETLGLDEAAYPDDLHPLVQNLVEEEVHNNHTTWSVIRTHHREALAESLAVFVQLTLGFCADLSVTVAKAGNPNTTDWAWGFATMIGIYISGGISGAHLNPTITTMLWFYRGFPKRKMPEYFLAQFIGAFCAALAAYGVYYLSIQNYLATNPTTGIVDSFVTSQRESYINAPTALFNEFVGTMMLTIAVLALGDDQNAPPGAGMNSFIIGLIICCLSMAFANQTGAALNPSRDFGPRLALLALGYGAGLFTNPYWFYGPWVGTLLGSFMGAFLYDFMIFTGGESPVNYPLERTRRSLYKSRMKWERRLHLIKKEVDNKDVHV